MNRFINLVRSDLFLSLAGGFALGIAGLTMINPAAANSGDTEVAKSISVEVPAHAETPQK